MSDSLKAQLTQALVEPSIGGALRDPQFYQDMARNLVQSLATTLPNGAGPIMSRRYPDLPTDPEYMQKMQGFVSPVFGPFRLGK